MHSLFNLPGISTLTCVMVGTYIEKNKNACNFQCLTSLTAFYHEVLNCRMSEVLSFEARVAETEAPHFNPSGFPSFLCANFASICKAKINVTFPYVLLEYFTIFIQYIKGSITSNFYRCDLKIVFDL